MKPEDIQKHILKKFMYAKDLTYNNIRTKDIESNKFNYHLQKLVEDSILTKQNNIYKLTSNGERLISELDGVQIDNKKKPIVCCFIIGVDENELILLNERKKQPFLGYVGIPGGKLDFSKTPLEQAKEEFLEETGLEGKLELSAIANYTTYNHDDKETSHHMIGFFYIAKELKGTLIEDNREGRCFFAKRKEIPTYNCYPDIPLMIEKCLESKQLFYADIYREQKDGTFLSVDIREEKIKKL
jgi:ADP-ribose pyrophosphatase YjhB (NUDIX family)/predicted transcriptional regulator